jgi:hypothetical protein
VRKLVASLGIERADELAPTEDAAPTVEIASGPNPTSAEASEPR